MSLYCIHTLHSQSHLGPSLTASTSKLAYQKGQLDSELIAEIVATKQAEIKSALMHRLVLNHFECSSFATWNFVRQNLEILLNERDKKVMTKEMLQSVTELAIVLGVAEYYMELLTHRKKLNSNQEIFLMEYLRWADVDSKNFAKKYFKYTLPASTTNNQQPKKAVSGSVGIQALGSVSSVNNQSQNLAQIRFLSNLKNSNNAYREKKQMYDRGMQLYCDNISPNHIFIDFVYDICRNNQTLKNYGFFTENGIEEGVYESKNKFLNFSDANSIKRSFEVVRGEIDTLMNTVFGSFEAIQYIVDQSNSGLSLESIKNKKSTLSYAPSIFNTIRKDLRNLPLDSLSSALGLNWDEEISNILTLATYQGVGGNDLLYFAEKKVLPSLIKLDMATPVRFEPAVKNLESLISDQRKKSLDSLHNQFGALLQVLHGRPMTSHADSLIETDFVNFIKLIDQIRNLDNPNTYQIIADFIVSAGDLFGDQRTEKLFKQISNDFDKYLLIDKEQNELTLEVEEMAVDLFTKYGENQSSRFKFHFSVGVNQGFGIRGSEDTEQPGLDSLDNLYYVAEKVGLKIKLLDWNRRFKYGTKNPGTRTSLRRSNALQPVVNDWHLLVYGSGLLYQIDFLNSEDDIFTNPVIGVGTGLGFFNGLDANISYAWIPGQNAGFFNLGFDIKITEYLGALRRKNRAD
ncbi:MAG: hypothetical protein RIF33_09040 [Cyclobacteriaceae bacterium]